jgi:uncharacterized protein YjiS (DUF1127 family)
MSTITLAFATVRPQRLLHWNKVKACFAEWRHRARSRRELANLSVTELLDIGLTRTDACHETSKPFWMA